MNKRLITILKLLALLLVGGLVGWQVYKAWNALAQQKVNIAIDWRWGGVAILGFAGSMLTASVVWRLLAWKMGDRSPTGRMIGAYTYSQMGKYIPGKVALLLMRMERAGRFGMSMQVCTLSTLLENALYMISGGVVGMLAIAKVAEGLSAAQRAIVWPATLGAIVILASACVPAVFYGLVNKLLKRMKKPEVPRGERLRAGTLMLAVLGFVPCWFFGGLALWGSTRAVHEVALGDCWWFAGAYALSVIIGMASLLPGGAGIREAILGAAVVMQLSPMAGMGHDRAVIFAGVVAILQRLFQVMVEILLGLMGAVVTASGTAASVNPSSGREEDPPSGTVQAVK